MNTNQIEYKEALHYKATEGQSVRCNLCPHFCEIPVNQKGRCHVRQNRDGKLFSLVYDTISIKNVDYVEKKPLYHFYPGSKTLSLAPYGCNFSCKYCINWEISQQKTSQGMFDSIPVTPQNLVESAIENHCSAIAYTYVEPTIFYELSLDVARLANASGLKNIYKTNGFITKEPLAEISPVLDAANVDLKTFNDDTYKTFGGRLQPVLDTLKFMKKAGVWVEVTSLIIPGINDGLDEIKAMAAFIANDLGTETPWHLSRFFPAYKMKQTPPTPADTILQARQIGLDAGLQNVYCSNLSTEGYKDTYCSNCQSLLFSRLGHKLIVKNIKEHSDACPFCKHKIDGHYI